MDTMIRHRCTRRRHRTGRLVRPRAALIAVAVAVLTGAAAADQSPEILSTLATVEDVADEFELWDIARIPLLPQSGVDPYGRGAYETPALVESWVQTHTPPDYDGYIVIDWHDGVTEPLLAGSTHERFEAVVAAMVSVVNDIKRLRPNAQVGYVGIPVFDYWSHGEAWHASIDAAKPLHDAVDVFFPDVRDVYGTEPERDLERLSTYVAATLELAAGRPVYLYTSHRYENLTERWGYRLIPRDEYVAHIAGLLAVDHDGVSASGVVASGNERQTFFAGASTKVRGGYVRTDPQWQRVRDAFAAETLADEGVDDYLTRLHPYVFCMLNEAVRAEPCTLDPPATD